MDSKTFKWIINIFLFTTLNLSNLHAQLAKDSDVIFEVGQIEKRFQINIIFSEKVKDTWSGSTYTIPANKQRLLWYFNILNEELLKYPAGYLQKAMADNVILTENYAFKGNQQAAMPDPYGRRLYLSINGARKNASEDYLRAVIHHELHHNTEYAIWKNQYYQWPQWAALNTTGFQYGKGGISAYSNLNVNWALRDNPQPGFLNLYSTLGQEEDRSEIMSSLMHDITSEGIINDFCKTDSIIKAKVNILVKEIEKFAGSSGYWRTQNPDCYDF